jgi:hypothetical protein
MGLDNTKDNTQDGSQGGHESMIEVEFLVEHDYIHIVEDHNMLNIP